MPSPSPASSSSSSSRTGGRDAHSVKVGLSVCIPWPAPAICTMTLSMPVARTVWIAACEAIGPQKPDVQYKNARISNQFKRVTLPLLKSFSVCLFALLIYIISVSTEHFLCFTRLLPASPRQWSRTSQQNYRLLWSELQMLWLSALMFSHFFWKQIPSWRTPIAWTSTVFPAAVKTCTGTDDSVEKT